MTGFRKWMSSRSRLGLAVVLVFLSALAAIGWNLHRLEQNQISAFRALAVNVSETAINFVIGKQNDNMFEFMAVLSQIPNIQYLAYWVGTQRALQAGNASALNPRRVAMPEESRDGTRDGAFLYFHIPLPQHEAVLKTQGHFQIVFSLQDFLRTKRNILVAAFIGILVLNILVLVLFQLHRVQDRLRTTQEQKSRMISTISHDTNHYLTVIRMKLENLLVRTRQAQPIEDLEGQLVMAKDNTESLAQLLDNLSAYERITETTFVLEPLELTALLAYECRGLEDVAARRGQKVKHEWTVSPCMVLADRMQLRRVVQNLLRNAMKFSPEGTTVRCTLAAEDGEAKVRIQDEGCGIPVDAWERVFQPYVRLQTAVKGTGLGLAIARELMRKMRGDLTILASAPESGTTFELRLPRVADEGGNDGGFVDRG